MPGTPPNNWSLYVLIDRGLAWQQVSLQVFPSLARCFAKRKSYDLLGIHSRSTCTFLFCMVSWSFNLGETETLLDLVRRRRCLTCTCALLMVRRSLLCTVESYGEGKLVQWLELCRTKRDYEAVEEFDGLQKPPTGLFFSSLSCHIALEGCPLIYVWTVSHIIVGRLHCRKTLESSSFYWFVNWFDGTRGVM
jgi:hypothetical protein